MSIDSTYEKFSPSLSSIGSHVSTTTLIDETKTHYESVEAMMRNHTPMEGLALTDLDTSNITTTTVSYNGISASA